MLVSLQMMLPLCMRACGYRSVCVSMCMRAMVLLSANYFIKLDCAPFTNLICSYWRWRTNMILPKIPTPFKFEQIRVYNTCAMLLLRYNLVHLTREHRQGSTHFELCMFISIRLYNTLQWQMYCALAWGSARPFRHPRAILARLRHNFSSLLPSHH